MCATILQRVRGIAIGNGLNMNLRDLMDDEDENEEEGLSLLDEDVDEGASLLDDEEAEEELEGLAQQTYLDDGDFYENIAVRIEENLDLGEQFLSKLGAEIIEHMENDKSARTVWENQIKVGVELLGTGFIGPDGSVDIPSLKKPFDQSSSNAYSSALLETLVSFISTAERELLPPGKVISIKSGVAETDEIADRNSRVETYSNDLLTQQCPDFYSQIPQAMMWAALAGEAYIKTTWDKIKNKPVFQKVSPLDLVLPATSSDISTSSRIIHRYKISERELRIRQESGFYRDIKVTAYQGDSAAEEDSFASRMDGVSQESSEDRLNPIYEIVEAHIELRLHKNLEPWSSRHDSTKQLKGIPLPYIVHISPISKKVLAIYRNWEEGDASATRLEWFAPLVFFPGLFGRGYGIAHLAGENSLTATRILRDILNLNTLNIIPGGVRQQGLRVANNQVKFNPGEFAQIDTGGLSVNQVFEKFQFPQPTPLMVEMKKDLEDGIRRIGGAIMTTPENVPPQIGQVSLLAMMEENSKTQSTVLQRFHRGLAYVYKILFRLLRQYIPQEGLPMQTEGDFQISAYDFQEDMAMVPVSDPALNSRLHRLMRAESVLGLAQQHPELHNFYQIYKMIYKDLPLDNADEILISPEDAQPLDPLTENMNIMQGKPAKAGIDQDHQSHITVHTLVAQDPEAQPAVQAAVSAHIQEHKALQMAVQLQSMSGVSMPTSDEADKKMSIEQQNQIAVQLAQAAQQLMEQQQGPQPIDQNQLMLQEIEQRKIAQEQKNKIDQMNIQLKFLEALTRDQRDKYDTSLKYFKETGAVPPPYDELIGEHQLTTSEALSMASQISEQTDQQLDQINSRDKQQDAQMEEAQQQGGDQQGQEEEYNPPLLPEEMDHQNQNGEQQEQQAGQEQQNEPPQEQQQ